MGGDIVAFRDRVARLVQEEIRRIVAEALERDLILHVGPAAERLARTYSAHGIQPAEIADELLRAGVSAGVTMEMSRPVPQTAGAA